MDTINRRMPFIIIELSILAAILIGQLLSFQFRLNPSISEFEQSTSDRTPLTQTISANRGQIYDRDGVVLAVNAFEYRVGVSPAIVIDRQEAAVQLATVLNSSEAEIYRKMQPNPNGEFDPYVLLTENEPVDDKTARAIEDLEISGVVIESIALRSYPQGALMSQILGFVNLTEQGYYGVEGEYDSLLAGATREIETDDDLFNVEEIPEARDGQSLVLTVDRDVQFAVQEVLQDAIETYNAKGGIIIAMNPKTGEILGMQSWPFFEPGNLPEQVEGGDPPVYNAAVSYTYEPGSVIKVVSAAITLQANKPGLDVNWTYNNTGCWDVAGITICDWSRVARGNVDFRTCLIVSLNTCTATWYKEIGPSNVYDVLQEFGFGQPTGVDIAAEEDGTLRLPDTEYWSEADFLSISFGQGIAVTPLQMLTAVNVIANDGLLMQPHIVKSRIDGDRIYEVSPNPVTRPISAEVADAVTEIMVATIALGTEDDAAHVAGYTAAGKTGTAQRPEPGGYSLVDSWASFVGFLPADDPIVSAIVILDRPNGYWGSATAAPVFRQLMERLVVILEIPPDDIRLQLMETGGEPFNRGYK